MKWIALLVGGMLVITGGSAAILATMGGLDNRSEIVETVQIDVPPDYAFKWISDPSYTPRWIRRLKKSKKITKGPIEVDSLLRDQMKTPDGVYELTGTCTVYEKDEVFEMNYKITGWTPKGRKLEARGKGDEPIDNIKSRFELSGEETTHLSYQVTTDFGPAYMRLLEPIATHVARKAIVGNLEDLQSRMTREYKQELERKQKAAKKQKKKAKAAAAKAAKRKKAKEENQKANSIKSHVSPLSPIAPKFDPQLIPTQLEKK